MRNSRYVRSLCVAVACYAATHGALAYSFREQVQPLFTLTCFLLIVFVAMTSGIFFAARYTAQHPNRQLFTQVFILSILLKMSVVLCGILFYAKLAHPVSRWYVLPFGYGYLYFTILEIYFLLRLVQQK